MSKLREQVAEKMKGFPLRSQEGLQDPIIGCKLFALAGSATWWLTEYEPETGHAFGFVTGMAEDEWWYVSVQELAELRFWPAPRVELDAVFEPVPMSEVRKKYASYFQ